MNSHLRLGDPSLERLGRHRLRTERLQRRIAHSGDGKCKHPTRADLARSVSPDRRRVAILLHRAARHAGRSAGIEAVDCARSCISLGKGWRGLGLAHSRAVRRANCGKACPWRRVVAARSDPRVGGAQGGRHRPCCRVGAGMVSTDYRAQPFLSTLAREKRSRARRACR